MHAPETYDYEKFQSPRSGQICSNAEVKRLENELLSLMFQSPRSGQICSNAEVKRLENELLSLMFQSPRSGQICSNNR